MWLILWCRKLGFATLHMPCLTNQILCLTNMPWLTAGINDMCRAMVVFVPLLILVSHHKDWNKSSSLVGFLQLEVDALQILYIEHALNG